MSRFWWIEPAWAGQTCVIVASGPSVTAAQVMRTRVHGVRTIAVNDNYKLAPWADIFYFCDPVWWSWHRADLKGREDRIVRLESPEHDGGDPRVRVLKNYGEKGLVEARDGVMTGRNSGYQALHMAVHLGVSRILLLGFDCKRGKNGLKHWFGEHPNRSEQPVVDWAQLFTELAPQLEQRGIEVINCSPDTALTCFKREPIESLLPDQEPAALPA